MNWPRQILPGLFLSHAGQRIEPLVTLTHRSI